MSLFIQPYVPGVATRRVVIIELTPSITVTAWAHYSGTCYRAPLSKWFDARLYRRVVAVRQNATELTESDFVDTTPGTYKWAIADGFLYVNCTSGAPSAYTITAFVTYYFATDGVTINRLAGDPDSGIYYQPWIIGDTLRLSRQISDLLFGLTIAETGDVSFSNGHGSWHTMIPGHNWRNKKARILMAEYAPTAPVPDRPDFEPIMTMIIEDIAANEERATTKLVGAQKLLDKMLPPTKFTATDYPNLGAGVEGTSKRLGWGRARLKPDLTDTSSHGVYTIADAAHQTLFAVHEVVAIEKSGGARTTLTVATDYTVDLTACTLTLTGTGVFVHDDYDIEVDVTGKPDGSGGYLKTFAQIVQSILQTHLSVPTSDLDAASFSNSDLIDASEFAVWLKAPRSIASIFNTAEGLPSLERSVFGTVRQTVDGKWTVRVWNDAALLTSIVLEKSDFVSFNPEPKIEALASVANVHYGQNHSDGSFPVASATDLVVQYEAEVFDSADIYTYLRETTAAEALAQRTLLIAQKNSIEVEFELRGSALARVLAGDFVTVTFSPAPVGSGAFDGARLQILRLDLAFHPTLKISGRLGTRDGAAFFGWSVRPNEFNFAAISAGFGSPLLSTTAAFYRRY